MLTQHENLRCVDKKDGRLVTTIRYDSGLFIDAIHICDDRRGDYYDAIQTYTGNRKPIRSSHKLIVFFLKI